jgi:deferrochelatase/peroxidase EfeB
MGLTRREVISSAALVGVGAGLDHLVAKAPKEIVTDSVSPDDSVPFYDTYQAGVATPAQDYLHFAAFDMTSDTADDLRGLLEQWTAATAQLTAGKPYQSLQQTPDEPPVDTGEAVGLGPSRLTITIGVGPSLFSSRGVGRFGIAHQKPAELAQLPAFQGEALDPSSSGGDLCVQACADYPQVAFHAIHVLSRVASSAATLRYTQQGFGRTSSTSRTQSTPRNLMGFKDGTENIRAEDTGAMSDFVWVRPGDGPDCRAGLPRAAQEAQDGRKRGESAAVIVHRVMAGGAAP